MILGPLDLLIIQGSPFCNIDCKYCYLPNRLSTKKIDIDTIRICIKRIFEEKLVNKEFSIVWHAGEPLAIKVDFYREVFHLLKELTPKGFKIKQFIQTNGMLITQKWCDFFKEANINVGVSIDGPKFLNDKNRITRSGKSTYDKLINGIKLLKENNIEFTAISVVTEDSLDYPNEIYDFFKSLKVKSLGLNIDEQVGDNETSSINDNNLHKLKKFWKTIYENNLKAGEYIHIREIFQFNELLLNPIFNKRKPMSGQMLGPLRIINLDKDGNFTTFSPELIDMKDKKYGDFILGNVHKDSFSSITKNKKFQKMYSEIIKGVEMCKNTCSYFSACGGGSPSNKLYENKTFISTETKFCISSRKVIADEIIEKNESLLGI